MTSDDRTGSSGETLTILLVEDNPAHAELVLRCFEDYPIANTICHVTDGEAALDYLYQRGAYADPERSPPPHLILLDLRLPKVDGLEVVQEIKTSLQLKHIPVVILTTSSAEADVAGAYAKHVNSYLVKPLDFDKFEQMMDDLGFYWLGWNHCPRSPADS